MRGLLRTKGAFCGPLAPGYSEIDNLTVQTDDPSCVFGRFFLRRLRFLGLA